MHFNDIFDYHSHICEKSNMTVRWLLLTVSLVVPHAGLIYLHNWGFTYMRLYGHCDLTFWKYFRKYKHFSDCIESCIESHSLHAPEMFSSVPTAKQGGESTKLMTKHSTLVIAEFELYHI